MSFYQMIHINFTLPVQNHTITRVISHSAGLCQFLLVNFDQGVTCCILKFQGSRVDMGGSKTGIVPITLEYLAVIIDSMYVLS